MRQAMLSLAAWGMLAVSLVSCGSTCEDAYANSLTVLENFKNKMKAQWRDQPIVDGLVAQYADNLEVRAELQLSVQRQSKDAILGICKSEQDAIDLSCLKQAKDLDRFYKCEGAEYLLVDMDGEGNAAKTDIP